MRQAAAAALLALAGCTCAAPAVVEPPAAAAAASPAERLERLRAEATAAWDAAADPEGLQAAVSRWEAVARLDPADPVPLDRLARAALLLGTQEALAAGLIHAEELLLRSEEPFARARLAGEPFLEAVGRIRTPAGYGALALYGEVLVAWARAGGGARVIAQRPYIEAIAEVLTGQPAPEGAATAGALLVHRSGAEGAAMRGALFASLPVAAGGDRAAALAWYEDALRKGQYPPALLVEAAEAGVADDALRRAWLEAARGSEQEGPRAAFARARAAQLLEQLGAAELPK